MPRILVIVLGVALACGGSQDVKPDTARGIAHHPAAVSGSVVGAGSGSSVAIVPDVGCLATTCVFHAGGAGYFFCLAGGAGACFHFGGPCTPSDGCMYDPGDHEYKACARAVEGRCEQWGGSCAPASACMFDPADGLHHHCEAIAHGGCAQYGALCSP